jgi:hypothetical protein
MRIRIAGNLARVARIKATRCCNGVAGVVPVRLASGEIR